MTSATLPTTGNACLKQAATTPLKGKLLMPMIHGPALPVSIWIKLKRTAASSTLRQERLWKSHGTQPGSQKNYKTRVKASSGASKSLKSKSPHQTYLSLHQRTPKWTWKTCQSSEKVTFDIQPTNPQVDVNITATGHCEYWITTIDLMEYQEKSTLSSPDDTMLPEVYTDTVTCIYNL